MTITALVGTRKGLFRDDRRQVRDPVLPVVHRFPRDECDRDPRDGALYASLDHGHFGVHFHRSDDDRRPWVEIAAPEYPPKPPGLSEINPMSQQERSWTTQLGWTVEPGHADEPGVLWCGTIPGGLFRSDDRGGSCGWSSRSGTSPPARSGSVAATTRPACIRSASIRAEPGRLVVGVSCGGAWRTDDGGETWTVAAHGMRSDFVPSDLADDPDTQDPHRIVRCPADPDSLWTQHHCGIFRSVDNGDWWTEIHEAGPSTFGFAVVVHPDDPDDGVVRSRRQRRGTRAGRRPAGRAHP